MLAGGRGRSTCRGLCWLLAGCVPVVMLALVTIAASAPTPQRAGRPAKVVLARSAAYQVGRGPSGLTAVDLNADGKLDMLTANYDSGNVSLLLGRGGGRFAPARNVATGRIPEVVAVADFNDDGALDLATANHEHGIYVLLADGHGGYAPPVRYTTGGDSWVVTVGDLNNDGKPDLVASAHPAGFSVRLGNGDGSFRAATTVAAEGTNWVVLADFNHDGKLDAAAASFDSRASMSSTVTAAAASGSITPTGRERPRRISPPLMSTTTDMSIC